MLVRGEREEATRARALQMTVVLEIPDECDPTPVKRAHSTPGHALILHCQAGAGPEGGEGSGSQPVVKRVQMYPQSAKIKLFVGIGK